MILERISDIGAATLSRIQAIGKSTLFLIELLSYIHYGVIRFKLFIKQMYYIGVQTLMIIIVAGFFVGMVLSLQGYNTLVDFGAEDSLGLMFSLTLVRELGPVVSALLFAGRAGSALAAEIGLMKTTEQLSGMEMMAVDPFKIIFAPRFLAGFISLPLLAVIFSAVGILGGYLVGVSLLGVDEGAFWSQMQHKVDFYEDVFSGVIKSIVFGFVTVWIALYQGYSCIPTSEGVSKATTNTVVYASLAILGLNFILTALMFGE